MSVFERTFTTLEEMKRPELERAVRDQSDLIHQLDAEVKHYRLLVNRVRQLLLFSECAFSDKKLTEKEMIDEIKVIMLGH